MLDDSTKKELLSLFSEFTEERLTQEQEHELAELLRNSSDARTLYVQHRLLEAKLRRRFGRLEFGEPMSPEDSAAMLPADLVSATSFDAAPFDPTEPIDVMCDLSELDPKAAWGITETTNQEDKDEETPGSPILSFLGDIYGGTSTFIVRHLTLLIVLLPILAIITVASLTPTLWNSPEKAWGIVARVHQTIDCQWGEECKEFENGDFLVASQPLNLDRGVVELEFYSGAKVILHGPARFTTVGENEGQLEFGRLTAKVEEEAHGFVVNTPSMDVTDLGTEFGIFVDTQRDSDVHVFKGEVSVKTNPLSHKGKDTLLTEEHAIHFDAKTGEVEKRVADPRVFVCDVDDLKSPLDYSVDFQTLMPSPGGRLCYAQARATLLPYEEGQQPEVLMVAQILNAQERGHDYRNLYQARSDDLGFSWTKPRVIPSLKRKVINAQKDERVIGDFYPKLHRKSGVVLGTGKTFTFPGGDIFKEDARQEIVSYSVYDTETGKWNGIQIVDLPELDHAGKGITEPNSGCAQRYDLPDGDILLPIRYRRAGATLKRGLYTSIVARCSFDGEKLTYLEHGSEMTIQRERGLYEPSITKFGDHYYLTLRADHNGFITRSTDGINFEPPREWRFDDGTLLQSINTQQHWVTHSDGLYLVYTRAGANNDHIVRNRAPLFMAQVDPERLCVIRSTERVLVPENNACIGNFGILDVSPFETWVITAEFPINARPTATARVIIAKIYWSKPNMAVEL